jgi:hypothetical protein
MLKFKQTKRRFKMISKPSKTKKLIIIFLLLASIQNSIDNIEPYWPKKLYRLSFKKNFGVGRGRIKTRRLKYYPKNKYEEDKNYPEVFKGLVLMTPDELEFISTEIKEPTETKVKSVNWINKLYMTFQYMICNDKLASLASKFGISYPTIINIIDEVLLYY